MVKVQISLEMYIECPHCDQTFDLIGDVSNYEGKWTKKLRAWLNNEKDALILNDEVECPECNTDIKLSELEY